MVFLIIKILKFVDKFYFVDENKNSLTWQFCVMLVIEDLCPLIYYIFYL